MSAAITTIGTILIHTPLWVWPLYALLLYLGFQRTRDRTVPLWRELILPLVVTVLAISSLVGGGMSALPAILPGLVIGGVAGWRLERGGGTRRLPGGDMWLRGEWWSFGQILLVLVFRYATAIVAAMAPAMNADPTWRTSTLFIASALSALFLGRTWARLQVYFSAGGLRVDANESSKVSRP